MIGTEIRQARGDRLQTDIAAAVGVSNQYLCDIEQGRRLPPPETIRRLAGVLGVDSGRWLWLWVVEQMGEESAADAARYGVAVRHCRVG
jgi:transcriptional regulator with XRE-family HTH domain